MYTNTGCASQMHRSLSSQSFLLHHNNNGVYPTVSSLPDSDAGPFRRVFSTGDLSQVVVNKEEQQGCPTSIINNKSLRYNPQERRVRIERYRNKRNRRNFNRKIQYICRKTLADTRPRIRGRFARNEDIETFDYSTALLQWNQIQGEGEEEDDDNWIHLLDSILPI